MTPVMRRTVLIDRLDLDSLLLEVGARWQHRFETAGRRLTVEPAGGGIVVGHAGVAQAIDILFDNALHHGAVNVTVTASSRADHVYLTVSDEGPGITHGSGPQAGSDEPARRPIALDLARRLVETEGGRLQIPSGSHPSAAIILLAGDGDESTSVAP
jgi:K+-sensing histidine kinase KdpD